MVNRPKPKPTHQSIGQAGQANANRPRNDGAQAGTSRNGRARKPAQAPLQGPLRRSIRIFRNKPSAFDPFSHEMQRLMIGQFLSKLDIAKQLQLRSVSQLWAGEVVRNCKMVKALVLFLKSEPDAPVPVVGHWTLKQRTDPAFFNWDEKDRGITIPPSQVKVLQISESHWNRQTMETIGRLFRHIKHLSIYDDTTDAEPDIDKYGALWSLLPNVEALFLQIVSPIAREDFLVRLFAQIEQHLAPLEALKVRIQPTIVFPRLPPENIVGTTRLLRYFVLTCSVVNMAEIVQMVGRDLHIRFPTEMLPIRELELDVPLIREAQVAPMFERNPALGQATCLKLNQVGIVKVVSALLGQSRALETLWLNRHRHTDICFGNELFTAVSKLPHLRKLFLFRFNIDDFGTIYKAKQATQLRELLVNNYGLFEHALAEWRKKHLALLDIYGYPRAEGVLYPELGETEEAVVRPFVANVAKIFPNLEVFVLVTNLAFVDQDAFKQWCYEEFKCAKLCGISTMPERIYRG